MPIWVFSVNFQCHLSNTRDQFKLGSEEIQGMCILIKILWFFFLGPMKVLYTIQSTKGLFKCIMMQRFFSIPCPCHLPIASLSSYIHTYIFNPWWDYLLVHGETIRNWHEKWYFTFFSRGIGIQFSTSNNTTSRNGHWLVYRHCAKLTK